LVELHFSAALPERALIEITAGAFGPNISERFSAMLGSSTIYYNLASTPQTISLQFDNDAPEHVLQLSIPIPISPKEIGIGSDSREIGLGLVELKVLGGD
jgi:phosphoglycerol transferase